MLSGKVKQFGPFAEALLFSIARQDHVDTVISDALARGQWVVCDRFLDSTRAYQGVTGGVPAPVISALERLTLHGLMPNLTIVLDIPVEEGLARARRRRTGAGPLRKPGFRASMSASAKPSSTSPRRSRPAAS